MCINNKWIYFSAFILLISIESYVKAYSSQWILEIDSNFITARRIALQHGFKNIHKVFPGLYHADHPSVRKRSVRPHDEINRRLANDTRIRRAVQQRIKSRQKRDLIYKKEPFHSKAELNDDRWSLMWYLNRGGGLDMNVEDVWAQGITGRGVVVSILDDGLEKDHPDLVRNYDPQASYDVNSFDKDPMPRYDVIDSNRHGTRCAGEVAATANNSFCAVGVAYGAGVGGVRMLDGEVTDAVEARSLSLNSNHIDIYSASWGPDDDGKTVDGPGQLATRAFIEGVTKGRNGKGSIFVWASGNGGRDEDNCNCDGYTNSIWTLSISSATERGQVPWYSEACSSTLATAYSSGSVGDKQIVTTDLHHHCTSSHTGTSASAPLAAGICALALEANPDLTWRDMQHIVVRTAKSANLIATDWVTNGVGRNVSHSFGYGLMQAAAMVKLAKKWRKVPEQHKCEMVAPHKNKSIPSRSRVPLEFHVKECSGVNFLEHVQVKITLSASRRGDIEITLISPLGTNTTLLTKRPHDDSKNGFKQWPFMSVHTWGERPHGSWKLEIHNHGRYVGRATLHEWTLIFYGTSTLPDRNEYALYSPANINPPKKPSVKMSNYLRNDFNTFGNKGSKQNKSIKTNNNIGNINQQYVTNLQGQTPKKSKVRGQHKNGKSSNRLSSRPTLQTLRGLMGNRVFPVTSKFINRSTSKPIIETTIKPTTQQSKQHTVYPGSSSSSSSSSPSSSLQRGLILMQPSNRNITNKVPLEFQQYSKIQQLYPLYPINLAGARGVDQHATRVKGLDLRQDQQFDSRHRQLTDKGSLSEWILVFYGTEEPPDRVDESTKEKPQSGTNESSEEGSNVPSNTDENVVDTGGDRWTGKQQVDLISHPEIQKPSAQNGASGLCRNFSSHNCLECKSGWHLFEGRCLMKCPMHTYEDHDEHKSVCIMCHYSCMTCSGSSDIECTSCYEDSLPISIRNNNFQCLLKSFHGEVQSTKWFYRLTVVLIINFIGLIIFCWIKWSKKKRKNTSNGDDVTILLPQNSERHDINILEQSELDSD